MNMKRMRGRNHRPNGGGGGGGGGFRNQQNGIPLNRNHVFDSSGPEMRVRGTAQQLFDKYIQLARDASSNGDRVLGEAYYQHAEHYFRIISAINQAQGQPVGGASQPQNGQERGNYQPQPNGQPQERGHYQPAQNGQSEYQRRDANGNELTNEAPLESRQQEPRRFEARPFEPRQRPDFVRNERNAPRQNGEPPMIDPRIDISSALEAELAAAAAEPAGYGEQPQIAQTPAAEPRAIPIISDAPPPAVADTPRPARARGRPRAAKPEIQKAEEI